MKTVDLVKAIYEFRKPLAEPNNMVRLTREVTGVLIGHKAFSDIMHDRESIKYIYTKPEQPFRFYCMDVPIYRTDDIDLDEFKIF